MIVFLATSVLFSAVPVVSAASPDFQVQPIAGYLSNRLLYPDARDMISVVAVNGFVGNVDLHLSVSTGLSASLDRSTVTLDSGHTSNTSQLFMSANSPGIYKVNVTGSAGILSHTATVILNMTTTATSDFLVFPLTTTDHIVRGSSDRIYVSFSSSGFSGNVNLRVGSLSDGVLISQRTSSVVLYDASSSSAGDDLTVSVPLDVPIGSYIVYLLSTSGSLAHLSIITVFAESAINIAANENNLKVDQGGTVSASITVSGRGGYEGTLSLAAQYDSQYFTVSFSPGKLELSRSIVSASSTIMITAAAILPTSSYTITVAASDGIVQNSTRITVGVTGLDFGIRSNPVDLTFQENMYAKQTRAITLTSLNGFSGNVNVTIHITPPTITYPPSPYPAPTGITLDPVTQLVMLHSGEVKSFTLAVTVASNATVGPRTIEITATSRINGVQFQHYAIVKATVGPDFTISSNTDMVIVHQGHLATATVTLHSLNGLSAGIILGPGTLMKDGEYLGVNPPSPAIDYYYSYPTLSASGTNSSRIIIKATMDTTLGTYDYYFNGEADTRPCCIIHQIYMKIIVEGPISEPDFTLSTSPVYLSVTLGSTGTSSITVTSQNGFSGKVSLETDFPRSAKINPSTVTLTSGGTAIATLTLRPERRLDLLGSYPIGYQSGTWSIRITGVKTSDGTGHDARVNATYAPFNIAANPSTVNIKPGESANTNLTLSGVYNWTGSVNLATNALPIDSTVKIDRTNLTIIRINTTATTIVTITVPATTQDGNYTVILSAHYLIPILAGLSRYDNINFTTPIIVHVASSSIQNQQPTSPLGFLSPMIMYSLLGIGTAAAVAGPGCILQNQERQAFNDWIVGTLPVETSLRAQFHLR